MNKKRKLTNASDCFKPGKASAYIQGWDTLKPGDNVFVCSRASTNPQEHNRNPFDQRDWLRAAAEKKGCVVVGELTRRWSGNDPVWLVPAADIAIACGAKLIAESTDRFIRPAANYQKFQATENDLKELQYWTKGLPLVTFVDPDATLSEPRRHQTKRGQAAKGNKGGRPRKIKRGHYGPRVLEADLARIRELLLKGMSGRQIALRLGRSPQTVAGWIRRIRSTRAGALSQP